MKTIDFSVKTYKFIIELEVKIIPLYTFVRFVVWLLFFVWHRLNKWITLLKG